jgi:hypothetical protein
MTGTGPVFTIIERNNFDYIECSLCRLIRRPEHLIGRHWYLPVNWRSFIRWSPDQWVSQCYGVECYRSFYCALFCVFMTRVSQCSISLRSEHPVDCRLSHMNHTKQERKKITVFSQCLFHCNKYELFLNVHVQLTTQIYSKLNVVHIIEP